LKQMADERNCDKLRVKWKHKTAVSNKSAIRRGTNLRFFLAIKDPRRSEKQRTRKNKEGAVLLLLQKSLAWGRWRAEREREREREEAKGCREDSGYFCVIKGWQTKAGNNSKPRRVTRPNWGMAFPAPHADSVILGTRCFSLSLASFEPFDKYFVVYAIRRPWEVYFDSAFDGLLWVCCIDLVSYLGWGMYLMVSFGFVVVDLVLYVGEGLGFRV
jgi:hypothetical protein